MGRLSPTHSFWFYLVLQAVNYHSGSGIQLGATISTRLISSVCGQKSRFLLSGQIQAPEKRASETNTVPCGGYGVTRCLDPKSGNCSGEIQFSFVDCEGVNEIKKFRRKPSSRIIGANNTKPHAYPSVLNLIEPISIPNGIWTLSCNAVIINTNWILSSARCLRGTVRHTGPEHFNVTAGDHRALKDEGMGREQVRKMNLIIEHPGYNFSRKHDEEFYYHDIALGRFDKPLELTEYVQPAVLPPKDLELQDGQIAVTVGWGETTPPFPDQPIDFPPGFDGRALVELELPVVNNKRCHELWKTYSTKDWVQDYHLCAGYYDRALPMTCGSDKGQPLYLIENGVQVVVGILSEESSGCYNASAPTMYMRLTYYLDWIEETIKANSY